jgi:predicted nucleic acid-binding protein
MSQLQSQDFIFQALRTLLFSLEIREGIAAIKPEKQNEVLRVLISRPSNVFNEIARALAQIERLMEKATTKKIQQEKYSAAEITTKPKMSPNDKAIALLRQVQRNAQELANTEYDAGTII